jgi:hypothetical protein
MIERRERFRFTLEAEQALPIGGEGLEDHLDGDVAAEPGVVGAKDLTHSAGAQRRQDSVRTEIRSGSEGHSRMRRFELGRWCQWIERYSTTSPARFARGRARDDMIRLRGMPSLARCRAAVIAVDTP